MDDCGVAGASARGGGDRATRARASIRGGRPDEAVTYVDGVPVIPGIGGWPYAEFHITSAPTRWRRPRSRPEPLRGVRERHVRIDLDPAPAAAGPASAARCPTRPTSRSGWATAWASTDRGVIGGPLARHLTFFAAGGLEGRKADSFRSRGSRDRAPIFVSGRSRYHGRRAERRESAPAPPRSMSTASPSSRGECDAVHGQRQRGHPRTTTGGPAVCIPAPFNPGTSRSARAQLHRTAPARGSALYWGPSQGRTFDYAISTIRQRCRVCGPEGRLTHTWRPRSWRARPSARWRCETYCSYQEDRTARSALTPGSERATRDPFGGFLLALGRSCSTSTPSRSTKLVRELRLNRPGPPTPVVTPRDPGSRAHDRSVPQQCLWSSPAGRTRAGRRASSASSGRTDMSRRRPRLAGRPIQPPEAGAELVRYSIGRYDTCCPLRAPSSIGRSPVERLPGRPPRPGRRRAGGRAPATTATAPRPARALPRHRLDQPAFRRVRAVPGSGAPIVGAGGIQGQAAVHPRTDPRTRLPEPPDPGLLPGH